MMQTETLFTIQGGKLVALNPGPVIPRGLGTSISFNLEAFVDQPGLMIGSWDQALHDDRPAAMSFTAGGTIVSVVIQNLDGDKVSLRDRIEAIQAWLAPMQLRDLSQLFTEPGTFYEGLWDMSPNATIALQDERRFVVVSAEDDVEPVYELGAIDGVEIDVVHLDVFTSANGDDPIIRWSPAKGAPLAEPTAGPEAALPDRQFSAAADDAAADGDTADGDTAADDEDDEDDDHVVADLRDPDIELRTDEVDVSDPAIDLPPTPVVDISSDAVPPPPPPPSGAGSESPPVIPGRTYAIETLPFLFDPDDEQLDSISDEMFAVPGHLVLVDKLPERRRQPSPFENPGRYRWDADSDQQTMLGNNLMDHHGTRSIHLFVESDRQPGLATYVGLLASASDNTAGRYSSSMWFDITPKVSAPLWQLFRKGRLPDLGAQAEVSTPG